MFAHEGGDGVFKVRAARIPCGLLGADTRGNAIQVKVAGRAFMGAGAETRDHIDLFWLGIGGGDGNIRIAEGRALPRCVESRELVMHITDRMFAGI